MNNALDEDSDNDGMPDVWEHTYSDDGLSLNNIDSADDPDSDDLMNLNEYHALTLPGDPDYDNDGLYDGWELLYGFDPLTDGETNLDPDSDGLSNIQEHHSYIATNPRETDTDMDGMPDGWECNYPEDTILGDISAGTIDPATFFCDPLLPDAYLDYDWDEEYLDYEINGLSGGYSFDWHVNNQNYDDYYCLDEETYQSHYKIFKGQTDEDPLFCNIEEYLWGTDPTKWDSDGDGMSDGWEAWYGLNPTDGIIRGYDDDSDWNSGSHDTNNDGSPTANYLGVLGINEDLDYYEDINSNGEYDKISDPLYKDLNANGYFDSGELRRNNAQATLSVGSVFFVATYTNPDINPYLPTLLYPLVDEEDDDLGTDVDGDGDYFELDTSEGLSVYDYHDLGLRKNEPNCDEEATTDPANEDGWDGDFDSDGWLNYIEYRSDFLLNNIYNPASADEDNDGMPDSWEIAYFGTTSRDGTGDFDSDGLLDIMEYTNGTFPNDHDTDADGMDDFFEIVINNFDPLNSQDASEDADGDGLTNVLECGYLSTSIGTNALEVDTDLDGLWDYDEYHGFLVNENRGIIGSEKVGNFIGGSIGLYGYKDKVGLNPGNYLNPFLSDSDGDGLFDGTEIAGWRVYVIPNTPNSNPYADDLSPESYPNWQVHSNPLNKNSDEDYVISDANGNGMLDSGEDIFYMNDLQEFECNSDPWALDTDDDGISDSIEYALRNPIDGEAFDFNPTEQCTSKPQFEVPELKQTYDTKWVKVYDMPWPIPDVKWLQIIIKLEVKVKVQTGLESYGTFYSCNEDGTNIDTSVELFGTSVSDLKAQLLDNKNDFIDMVLVGDTYVTESKFDLNFWEDAFAGYKIQIKGIGFGSQPIETPPIPGGLKSMLDKLTALFLGLINPVYAGFITGFLEGFGKGLYEDLSTFLNIKELWNGLKQIPSAISSIVKELGTFVKQMFQDMINNIVLGAKIASPFHGSQSERSLDFDWISLIIGIVTDSSGNLDLDIRNMVEKIQDIVSSKFQSFITARVIGHFVGYIIEQFVIDVMGTGGAALVTKIGDVSQVANIVSKVTKGLSKAAGAVKKGISKIGLICRKVKEGIQRAIARISLWYKKTFKYSNVEDFATWMNKIDDPLVANRFIKGLETGMPNPDCLNRAFKSFADDGFDLKAIKKVDKDGLLDVTKKGADLKGEEFAKWFDEFTDGGNDFTKLDNYMDDLENLKNVDGLQRVKNKNLQQICGDGSNSLMAEISVASNKIGPENIETMEQFIESPSGFNTDFDIVHTDGTIIEVKTGGYKKINGDLNDKALVWQDWDPNGLYEVYVPASEVGGVQLHCANNIDLHIMVYSI